MLPPHTSEKLQPDQIADIDNKMNRQILIAIMSLRDSGGLQRWKKRQAWQARLCYFSPKLC